KLSDADVSESEAKGQCDARHSEQHVEPECDDDRPIKLEYKMKRFKTLARKGLDEEILPEEVQKEKVVGKGKEKVVGKGKEKVVGKGKETVESEDVKVDKFGCYGTLRSRMSPSSVVQVVGGLTQKQLKGIRDIGFGSLEFLKVSQLPLQLGLWIVKNFDANTCCLCIPDSEPLHITSEHVHEVLGLPIGGDDIDLDCCFKDKDLLNRWKNQFKKNSICVKIGDLTSFLKQNRSNSLMFKRNFVILCVSTLMSGGQNMNVNHWILRYLGDVDRIKNLNWSKFILDCLVDSKKYWDELPSRYFPGSLLFLMLLYVDRFVIEDVRVEREIPILKGDKNEPKSGVSCSSGKKSVSEPKMEKFVSSHLGEDEDIEEEEDPKKKCLMELATASTNLVLAYMDFGKKHEAAIKLFPNNEKIRKLKQDAMLICDEQKLHSEVSNEGKTLSFSQDEEYWQDPANPNPNIDASVLPTKSTSVQNVYKRSSVGKGCESAINVSAPVAAKSVEAIVAEINKGVVDENINEGFMNEQQPDHGSVAGTEVNNGTEPEQVTTSTDFSSKTEAVERGVAAATEVNNETEPEQVTTSSTDFNSKTEAVHPERGAAAATEVNIATEVVDPEHIVVAATEFGTKTKGVHLEHATSSEVHTATKTKSRNSRQNLAKAVQIVLKRKAETEKEGTNLKKKRKVQPSKMFRSPYKCRVVNFQTPLTKAQKVLMDSVFDEEKCRFDVVFAYNSSVNDDESLEILRFQLASLKSSTEVPGENAWSSILNYNEKFKDPTSPTRFFFTLLATECILHYESDSVDQRNNMFHAIAEKELSKSLFAKKDIQLFFFPVYQNGHYFLVCFNMNTLHGTMEVIDWNEGCADYNKFVKNLKSAFSFVMDCQGAILCKEIKNMGTALVPFPWKSVDENHLDCGVVLMRHMETYMGSRIWDSGLKKNDLTVIEKLRMKYCYSIYSSDLNAANSGHQQPKGRPKKAQKKEKAPI
ncbi:Xylose isomerase, partial [Bienertia sinuspersici]